jgi:hypothetical protein
MTQPRSAELVLALHPFARGVAFALFEGPMSPVDWGIRDARRGEKNARSLNNARRLIEQWQPDVLVMEDDASRPTRAQRIKRLHHLIRNHAEGQTLELRLFTRADVKACFRTVGAVSRYEIAQAIASQFAGLADRLPPAPRTWASQHEPMTVFDAAALALTFYLRQSQVIDLENLTVGGATALGTA